MLKYYLLSYLEGITIKKGTIEFFISRSYGGGAEKSAMKLYDILNITYNINIITIFKDNQNINSLDVNHIKMGILSYPLIFIFTINRYMKYKKYNKTDMVITFLLLEHIISLLVNKKTKKIFTIHTSYFNRFERTFLNRYILALIGYFLRKADYLIVVSEGVKKELIDKFHVSENKIAVIYNPIDLETIQEMSLEKITDEWYNPNKSYIINISRLEPKKGHDYLIKSFNLIKDETDSLLIICGNGSKFEELSNLINILNLSNRVILKGWVDNPYKYLVHSSVFVLPSQLEALPYSIIEALATGTNVISTDCEYGPSEVLEGGRLGILIPLNRNDMDIENQKILADLMIEFLLLGRNEEIEKNGKASLYRYSMITIKNKYINVINKLI